MRMYEQAYNYVKRYLEDHSAEMCTGNMFPFRKRSDHMKRVFIWSRRLSEGSDNMDKKALLMAALFHDVGYAIETNASSHAESSAVICSDYLHGQGFEPAYVKQVVDLVKNHSKKEWLKDSKTSKELVFLMEADLLDETGALSIVWDCMVEGAQEVQTFEKTKGHISGFSGKTMMHNPMVTPRAIAFWERKQLLVKQFIDQLEFDIGSDGEGVNEYYEKIG